MSPTSSSTTSPSAAPPPALLHQYYKEKTYLARPAFKRSRELLLEQRQNILIIKINRPHCKNALNRNAVYELMAAINQATHNANIKLVVITGVGDVFCAGVDLKQIQDYQNPADYYLGANYILKAFAKTLIFCPKIIVCLVNGPCIGIGFTMASLCDVVYCTRNAYFQTPFTQKGLCPEACSSRTFPQIFGTSWSTKLLVFNETLTAEKAESLGFVADVFETEKDVEEILWPKLEMYSKLPANPVSVTKRLICMPKRPGLLAALDEELKEIEKLRKGAVFQGVLRDYVRKPQAGIISKL